MTTCQTIELPGDHQVVVEWDRDADWGCHWVVAVHNRAERRVIARLGGYDEARKAARRFAGKVLGAPA